MENLVLYIFYSSINILIIGSFHFFMLKKSTSHSYNRRFIVLGLLFSILPGFIAFPGMQEVSSNSSVYSYQLPEVIIGISATIDNSANELYNTLIHMGLVKYVFLFVSFLLLLRLILSLAYLIASVLVKNKISIHRLKVIPIKEKISPFSFFWYVFIPDYLMSDSDLESVLLHEKAHIKKNHFIDLMFIELLLVLFWFHPAIWYLRKEIKLVHEYEADSYVLKQFKEKYNYQKLLLEMSIVNSRIHIINLFSHSPIKKRIIMMNKENRSHKAFNAISLVIVSILFISGYIFQSCNTHEKEKSDIVDIKEQVTDAYALQNDTIYEKVDVVPEFPGGTNAMMQFVAGNIKYPEKSRQEGVQGTVFVSFVITTDGKVSNPEIAQGVNSEIDAEALRVIRMMPDWTPGRMKSGEVVNTQFRMPIRFALQ